MSIIDEEPSPGVETSPSNPTDAPTDSSGDTEFHSPQTSTPLGETASNPGLGVPAPMNNLQATTTQSSTAALTGEPVANVSTPTTPRVDSGQGTPQLEATAHPPADASESTEPAPMVDPNWTFVRFEIMIVKVPLLMGLYGLRFRQVAGPTWQYKHICSSILRELRL
ncbi:kinase associated domain 1-domain-containing protein [Dimargaris cristalligena]|uniref:non-specific serine/threonine protein kinase n=1 Tax=Dimargaris cristalligena TaxID=215637 RepID=A0A4P9ZR12_9FUNG|nr:kinase associated domain 1-domain-containing protein [Dimargaris cristalligena]|eukprot:RKP34870.1 kinase associated domain 1-domain-containing protein [Dimargaris cristalligena]